MRKAAVLAQLDPGFSVTVKPSAAPLLDMILRFHLNVPLFVILSVSFLFFYSEHARLE